MLVEPPPFTLGLMKLVVNYFPFIDYILPLVFIGSGMAIWAYSLKMNFRKAPILALRLPYIKPEPIPSAPSILSSPSPENSLEVTDKNLQCDV